MFVVSVLAMLAMAAPAAAAPGDLDRRFGINGKLDLGAVNNSAEIEVLQQKNGRILVDAGLRIQAIRSTGKTDTSFGNNGSVTLDRLSTQAVVAADDSIYLLEVADNGTSRILKFSPNGARSPIYGGSGQVNVDSLIAGRGETQIVAHSTGVLLYKAVEPPSTGGSASIIRLDANGSPDQNFGVNGEATISQVGTLAALADQSLIAVNGHFLTKYTATGQKDATFGAGGSIRVDTIPSGTASTGNVRGLPDGSFVLQLTNFFFGRGAGQSTYLQKIRSNGELVGPATAGVGTQGAVLENGEPLTFGSSDSRMMIQFGFDPGAGRPVSLGAAGIPVGIAPAGGRNAIAFGVDCHTECRLRAAKILGGHGSDLAPIPWLEHPRPGSYRAKPIRRVFGSARPVGVVRVLVAIRKESTRHCLWLSTKTRKFVRRKMTDFGSCKRPVWNRAKGARAWQLELPRRLSPGRYSIHARAVRRDGKSNPFNFDSDSYAEIRVVPRRR